MHPSVGASRIHAVGAVALAFRTARLAAAALLVAAPAALANPIAGENALPGNPPSEWDITGDGDPSIQGFATDTSVDQGGTIDFKIDTPATDYRIDIYRLGYYGGLGARRAATIQPSAALPQSQPPCLEDPAVHLIDCGTWAVSASWTVPADAVSGIYIAKLVREDPEDGRASHVVFVVRDDDGGSDILFQTSDTTWQAYNRYRDWSLYSIPRAYKVSYNRPLVLRGDQPWDTVFNAEYPMLRWLERNGYDVSYTTGADTDRRGAEILEHQVFLSVGHDEYWSRGQREAVEAARDAGVHLAFLSGNEIYWKTRWEPSLDGSATPHRTLVCYKESYNGAKIDPLPDVWTGWWRDCRFTPPADGCEPENRLSGQISWTAATCGGTTCGIQVPSTYAPMRLWRHTDIASLPPGQVAVFPPATLGFEWDYQQYEMENPPGLVWLSSTTVSGLDHHLSLYRHTSGALVFGAGTIQWSWGLDDQHTQARLPPVSGGPPDARMRQATVNLLGEMGVQPLTLQAGLIPAVPSNDSQPPVSTIEFPAAGDSLLSGVVEINGIASDAEGVVGVVEVSTDGGITWSRATGRESWSIAWTVPTQAGQVTLRSRAADDLGNLEAPGPGVTVTVVGAPLEIASLGVEDSLHVNGVGVAHITVISRSNAGASDSLHVQVWVTSHRGDRFEIGTDDFALAAHSQHTSEFWWSVPAAAHPWEFAVRAELSCGGASVETETLDAAFTGTVMTQAELQQALDLLVGPAGCLAPGTGCTTEVTGATPYFGTYTGFAAALPALCQASAALGAGDPVAAGVSGLGALLGALGTTLDFLPRDGTVADVIPQAVSNPVACHAALLADGLVAVPASLAVDSLATVVAALFAQIGRGYAGEVFVRGPVDLRIRYEGHRTSRSSVGLRDAYVFDLGAAGVQWAHVGREPLPLGGGGTNTRAVFAVDLVASGSGLVDIALLHRTSADSTRWIRYEPFPVTATTIVRANLWDDQSYPWGFGLQEDTQNDGIVDAIHYPGGVALSHAGAPEGIAFRLFPNQPNPFATSTTLRYVLPGPGPVTVTVHDVRGRLLRTLSQGPQAAGTRHVSWTRPHDLPGGVYILRVVTPWGTAAEKLTLAK